MAHLNSPQPQTEDRKLPTRVSVMLTFLSLCSYGHGGASALSIAAGCFYGRPLLALAGVILGLSAYGGALAHQRLLDQANAIFMDEAAAKVRSDRSEDRLG